MAGKTGNRPDDDPRKLKKEMRIEALRRLMLKGIVRGDELQAAMKRQGHELTMRTIYRYKSILTKRTHEKLSEKGELQKSVEELAFQLSEQFEEIQRNLWVEYHRNEVTKTQTCECGREHPLTIRISADKKVQALNSIARMVKDHVEIMQSLGLTFKAPDKLQHQAVGADGKPIQEEADKLSADFTAFIKAKYQKPLGIIDGEVVEDDK